MPDMARLSSTPFPGGSWRSSETGSRPPTLRYMRQFYQCWLPKYHTLCDKLSWSHCRTLLKVSGDAARDFYLHECVKENWSVRQLDRQINTLFYDRLLASRDKKAVKEEISRTEPGRVEPKEIIRDPYILEFLGIPQGEHFLETDLEQLSCRKCDDNAHGHMKKKADGNLYFRRLFVYLDPFLRGAVLGRSIPISSAER